MSHDLLPSIQEIQDTFVQEIAAAGGKLSDQFQEGRTLILRSILPLRAEVCPGDGFAAGVALRAFGENVAVYPYTFRQVCSNGAILVQSIEGRELVCPGEEPSAYELSEWFEGLREATRCCCRDDAFANAITQMRHARATRGDFVLMLLPHLAKLPREAASRMMQDILGRLQADGDRSAYGLMNAVTATARDTRDPNLRWRLEELGGSIPARLRIAPRGGGRRRALVVSV